MSRLPPVIRAAPCPEAATFPHRHSTNDVACSIKASSQAEWTPSREEGLWKVAQETGPMLGNHNSSAIVADLERARSFYSDMLGLERADGNILHINSMCVRAATPGPATTSV